MSDHAVVEDKAGMFEVVATYMAPGSGWSMLLSHNEPLRRMEVVFTRKHPTKACARIEAVSLCRTGFWLANDQFVAPGAIVGMWVREVTT